ncbi:DUF1697 domain-containing protein [Amylibacter sp. SFDW26]|uniref:DUF1697 domain-containing protein n=1 Tax=Amylibacter sp. SFDW26 TaxID=2652722 RepID=UPI001262507E|nr:DUF1697 domain-containing protein [Amylibacter sp. SFDW26]KAB7615506.1 DUF1697 domain-containing protein [Amylibacter sp. SFDW26]
MSIQHHNTWAFLLRGVNVGGHNILKMAELRTALFDAGFLSAQTYIQSGNIVVQSDMDFNAAYDLFKRVLNTKFDIDVPMIALSHSDIEEVLAQIPFQGDPSRILIYFFISKPEEKLDMQPLMAFATETEQLFQNNNGIILSAPDGIGRSKLAAKLESLLPVAVTARNLRSVSKIAALMVAE